MPLKTYTIQLQTFWKNDTLRMWLPFELPILKYKYDKINNYLATCESGSRPTWWISEEDFWWAISLGGEQINKDGSVDLSKIPYVSVDFYEEAKKWKVQNEDILICKDGALTWKTCFVDFSIFPSQEVMANEHVYILRWNEATNQKFLFYYTCNPLFQGQVKDLAYRKKAQPWLNSEHFRKIKIPKIPLSLQNAIVEEIEPIEERITEFKSRIVPASEIINRVFAREFEFDEGFCQELGKGMTASTQSLEERRLKIFETAFFDLARSTILRQSSRFHNPPTRKLMDFLATLKTIEVQDILTEDIHRGASPQYDENGDIPVIKTGHLKNGYINISTEEFVNEEFYKNSTRSQARYWDVLIASTGKGSLGKIDILEEEEKEFVVDSHVSIVRVDREKYNPLFFVFFFRSILGYFQFERDFTGATNQIELYANEIEQFRIPNISITEQQRIVDEIKTELDAQKVMEETIASERMKIDVIIEKAINP